MKFSKPLKIAIYLTIMVLLLGTVYFVLDRTGFLKTFKLAMQLQEQQEQQVQDKEVLERLSTIILLPKDITPTMAVINDIENLKIQQPAFFTDAKNGDRVIIYPTMAIVYDYKENKIIHVGPVQVQEADQSAKTTTDLEKNIKTVPKK